MCRSLKVLGGITQTMHKITPQMKKHPKFRPQERGVLPPVGNDCLIFIFVGNSGSVSSVVIITTPSRRASYGCSQSPKYPPARKHQLYSACDITWPGRKSTTHAPPRNSSSWSVVYHQYTLTSKLHGPGIHCEPHLRRYPFSTPPPRYKLASAGAQHVPMVTPCIRG